QRTAHQDSISEVASAIGGGQDVVRVGLCVGHAGDADHALASELLTHAQRGNGHLLGSRVARAHFDDRGAGEPDAKHSVVFDRNPIGAQDGDRADLPVVHAIHEVAGTQLGNGSVAGGGCNGSVGGGAFTVKAGAVAAPADAVVQRALGQDAFIVAAQAHLLVFAARARFARADGWFAGPDGIGPERATRRQHAPDAALVLAAVPIAVAPLGWRDRAHARERQGAVLAIAHAVRWTVPILVTLALGERSGEVLDAGSAHTRRATGSRGRARRTAATCRRCRQRSARGPTARGRVRAGYPGAPAGRAR